MASYQQPPVNPGYQQPGYQPQGNNPYQQQPGWSVPNQQGGQAYYPPNSSSPNPNQMENGMPKNELGFDDQTIRAAFVRKVFFLVAVMLSVVTAMCSVPYFHKPLQDYAKHNFGLYLASLITFIVVYFVLMCCDSVRRTFPTNLICTGILTVSIGFVTMVITAYYSFESVLMAAGITTVCCVGVALFAMTTKRDITSMMGFMFIATLVLLLFGILMIFFYNQALHVVYASLGALLFMVWLAIDIQMIMGGKKFEISPEEHIFAAIMLFLDIIQIFWFILSLVGDRS